MHFWLRIEMREDPYSQPYDRMLPLQSRFVRRVVQGEHECVTDTLCDESVIVLLETGEVESQ